MIESIRERFGEDMPFEEDDFVLMEDLVVIDYIGKLNGENFKNNIGKNVTLRVGTNSAVAGFEDKLIGMKVGESAEFDITFKDDFSVKQIAGKTVTFSVLLKEAKRKKPIEVGENLFKKLQVENQEAFNAMLAREVKNQMDISKLSALRNDVVVKLLEKNPIEIPSWMAVDVAKGICDKQKLEWESIDQDKRAELLKNSADKIRLSFIINKIKGLEPEAELSALEISSIMNNNLGRFPEQVRNQLLSRSNPYLYAKIASEIQDEHVIKWVVNSAVLLEETETMTEVEQTTTIEEEV
jgi:trigger factor